MQVRANFSSKISEIFFDHFSHRTVEDKVVRVELEREDELIERLTVFLQEKVSFSCLHTSTNDCCVQKEEDRQAKIQQLKAIRAADVVDDAGDGQLPVQEQRRIATLERANLAAQAELAILEAAEEHGPADVSDQQVFLLIFDCFRWIV